VLIQAYKLLNIKTKKTGLGGNKQAKKVLGTGLWNNQQKMLGGCCWSSRRGVARPTQLALVSADL
jgi:hypothetical protein